MHVGWQWSGDGVHLCGGRRRRQALREVLCRHEALACISAKEAGGCSGLCLHAWCEMHERRWFLKLANVNK